MYHKTCKSTAVM